MPSRKGSAAAATATPRSADASCRIIEQDRLELTAALAAALADAETFRLLGAGATPEQLQVLGERLARAGNRLGEAAYWRHRGATQT